MADLIGEYDYNDDLEVWPFQHFENTFCIDVVENHYWCIHLF